MFYVYILTSQRNGTIYVGLTSDLKRRVYEHKSGIVEGFTKRYGVKMLVYYEAIESFESALRREKRMKEWNRIWKLHLIESKNPAWRDLSDDL
jgi:putative endonuclease